MKNSARDLLLGLGLLTILNAQPSTCRAQGTAFTYQGWLNDGANPASGTYDLRFALYDASSGGAQQGPTRTNATTAASNGLFTVTLDFGNQFPGADRWLEIGVRTNGAGGFSTLSPRQQLTATPYAIYAGNASNLLGTVSAGNIAAGSISSLMLANGAVGSNQLAAGAVTTEVLANGAVTSAKVGTVSNWFPFPLPHPVPEPFDGYGNSLAAVGTNLVLIGASSNDEGSEDSGAAYLLNYNGSLARSLRNPFVEFRGRFGSSVAGIGQTHFIIGAPDNDEFGPVDSGAAYLYRMDGTRERTFTKPAPRSGDERFGSAVCGLGPAHILIAAEHALGPSGEFASGTVHLFRTNGPLVTTFTNPTPAVGDAFGAAIAPLGTDRVLIAAPGDDTGANDAGAAYLFGTNGVLLKTFANPTSAASDRFGQAIAAVGGSLVMIGASGDDTGATDAGAAYLFSTNGALLVTFTNPSPAAADFFGSSVAALADDLVVIGASGDDVGRANSGAAYLFHVSGTLVAVFQDNPGSASTSLGGALAVVDSGRVLIGGSGSAFLFQREAFTPGLIASELRLGTITTAHLADGAVTAAKIGGKLGASQIPELDASILTSGTLNSARLSTNVALLNRSPQTFTGENNFTQPVGIGTSSPEAELHVQRASAGAVTASSAALLALENDTNAFLHLLTPAGAASGVLFGSPVDAFDASIRYNFFGGRELIFRPGGNSTRMVILTNGNVGIGNNAPSDRFVVVNARCDGSSWINASDRNLKQDFAPVDPLAVLAKVAAMPIQSWSYTNRPGVKHVGPVAQDFRAAFGLGSSDTAIATVDADGVALAAIQGLNQKHEAEVQSKDARIRELEARLERLERMMAAKGAAR